RVEEGAPFQIRRAAVLLALRQQLQVARVVAVLEVERIDRSGDRAYPHLGLADFGFVQVAEVHDAAGPRQDDEDSDHQHDFHQSEAGAPRRTPSAWSITYHHGLLPQ